MFNFLEEEGSSALRFYFSFKWSEMSSSIKASIIIFAFLIIFFVVMGIVFSKMDPEKDEIPTKGIKFLCVLLVDTINNFVDNNLGEKNRKIYSPYLLGVASFLMLANIAGCFGLNPPMANLAVALSMSIIAFMIFQFTGFKFQGVKERIKGFMGPVKMVSFLVFPISIIGEFTTPLSMGLRLFGNLFSGVIIAGIVLAASNALGVILGSIVGTIFTAVLIHTIFDIFFGALQMYVYFMLITMFCKQNM